MVVFFYFFGGVQYKVEQEREDPLISRHSWQAPVQGADIELATDNELLGWLGWLGWQVHDFV